MVFGTMSIIISRYSWYKYKKYPTFKVGEIEVIRRIA